MNCLFHSLFGLFWGPPCMLTNSIQTAWPAVGANISATRRWSFKWLKVQCLLLAQMTLQNFPIWNLISSLNLIISTLIGVLDCIVIILEKNACYKNTDFYLVENYRNSRWVMKINLNWNKILEAQITHQPKPTVLWQLKIAHLKWTILPSKQRFSTLKPLKTYLFVRIRYVYWING